MRILITGSKGMLGQYIADVFSDCDLVCLDRKELDITNENEVNSKIVQIKPDVIINCAAYNNVDKAESEPDLANLINGYAVGFLAKAAKNINALLVHYSTNYVFNGDNPLTQQPRLSGGLYSEEDRPDTRSAYGASKLLGEQEVQKYADKYYIIRTSRLFGKQGATEDAKKSFVDLIVETAKQNNYKIKAIDEEYDLPTYAFDLAQKTREIIESPLIRGVKDGVRQYAPYGIYHIVNSGKPCAWYGFASEIFNIKNMKVDIEAVKSDAFGERPAKRLKYGMLNNTKLKHLREWQKALKEYLNV